MVFVETFPRDAVFNVMKACGLGLARYCWQSEMNHKLKF
jgi:hypothetical protein